VGTADRRDEDLHGVTSTGFSVPISKGSAAAEFLTLREGYVPDHSGATVPDSHRVPRTATLLAGTLPGAARRN
jgi:hypothetical protein